ncbi:MAG: alpha/beta hydrolase [Candidatus Krumholzibacteriota bacterium]
MRVKAIVFLSLILLLMSVVSFSAEKPDSWREVTFPSPDGGTVSADLYGDGDHGVILAHGRIFDKQSWRPLATRLAQEEMTALPIDFRGYGSSQPGEQEGALHNDVLAAITYLQEAGMEKVSVIGGSMGGGAAARAAVASEEGDIHRLILLSPVPIEHPEEIRAGSLLYVVSAEEGMFEAVKSQYEKAPEPKRLEILPGAAHAQHIFKTSLGDDLSELLIGFLDGANEEVSPAPAE